MKKKCAFIIPYYGHFPNYFQVFLKTCGANPDYDWLIFTDDHTPYDYPENVHVHYEAFTDMQQRAQRHFDFPISLSTPYKLCDFRPTYGLLFEEYLTNYTHWGHCDCDVVFGQLNCFITDAMLDDYDKLFTQGHCTIYKNTPSVNRAFMLPLNGEEIYKTVFSHNRAFTFDESYLPTNVNRVFEQNGLKIFKPDLSANTDSRSNIFRLTHYDAALDVYMTEAKLRAVYVWDNGTLTRSYFRLDEFKQRELMYMHLQRRAMKVDTAILTKNRFKIIPGLFTSLEVDRITVDNFHQIKYKNHTNHQWRLFKSDICFWEKRIINRLLPPR